MIEARDASRLEELVTEFEMTVINEYRKIENHITIYCESGSETTEKVLDDEAREKIIEDAHKKADEIVGDARDKAQKEHDRLIARAGGRARSLRCSSSQKRKPHGRSVPCRQHRHSAVRRFAFGNFCCRCIFTVTIRC